MPEYTNGKLNINLTKVNLTVEEAEVICEAYNAIIQEHFSSDGDYYMMTYSNVLDSTQQQGGD